MQHASYGREKTFILMDKDRELRGEPDGKTMPVPDYFFVMGDLCREILREDGFPEERIFVKGSARYDHIKVEVRKFNHKQGAAIKVLLVPTLNLKFELEMIEAAFWAANGLNVKLFLRSHPFARMEDLWAYRPYRESIISSTCSLEEDLNSADLVLFTYSTVAEEAFLRGIPVLHWRPCGFNGSVFREIKVVPSFYSIKELREAFEHFIAQPSLFKPENVAKKMADFIVEKMQRLDGLLYYAFNTRSNACLEDDNKWSKQGGAFHAKVGIGLVKLFSVTKEERYKKSAERICESALRFQEPNGRFVSLAQTKDTYLHPHCYAAEGLFYVGKELKIEKFIVAAFKATKWALDNQLKDGGIPQIYYSSKDTFLDLERTDVLAQALGLGLSFYKEGYLLDESYKNRLFRLKKRLENFQKKKGEQIGGFYAGYDEEHVLLNHVNSCCTMFAIQAVSEFRKIFPIYISFVLGTRPEIIKMWPLIHYCQQYKISHSLSQEYH